MLSSRSKNSKSSHAFGSLQKMRISAILNDSEDMPYSMRYEINKENDSDMDETMQVEDEDDSGSSTAPTTISSSSRSSLTGRRPHPPTRKYTTEQTYFIWYYRTDLRKDWDYVERAFFRQFGDKREKGGLQCKFYRLLEQKKVEKVREQSRSGRKRNGDMIGRFGVVQRTSVRYPWMRPEDIVRRPLPCFNNAGGCGNRICVTCTATRRL